MSGPNENPQNILDDQNQNIDPANQNAENAESVKQQSVNQRGDAMEHVSATAAQSAEKEGNRVVDVSIDTTDTELLANNLDLYEEMKFAIDSAKENILLEIEDELSKVLKRIDPAVMGALNTAMTSFFNYEFGLYQNALMSTTDAEKRASYIRGFNKRMKEVQAILIKNGLKNIAIYGVNPETVARLKSGMEELMVGLVHWTDPKLKEAVAWALSWDRGENEGISESQKKEYMKVMAQNFDQSPGAFKTIIKLFSNENRELFYSVYAEVNGNQSAGEDQLRSIINNEEQSELQDFKKAAEEYENDHNAFNTAFNKNITGPKVLNFLADAWVAATMGTNIAMTSLVSLKNTKNTNMSRFQRAEDVIVSNLSNKWTLVAGGVGFAKKMLTTEPELNDEEILKNQQVEVYKADKEYQHLDANLAYELAAMHASQEYATNDYRNALITHLEKQKSNAQTQDQITYYDVLISQAKKFIDEEKSEGAVFSLANNLHALNISEPDGEGQKRYRKATQLGALES